MTFEEYQRLAEETMNPEHDAKTRIGNCALGLCDETAAELMEHVFVMGTDGNYDLNTELLDSEIRPRIVEELGDMMWYASTLADSMGLQIAEVCKDSMGSGGFNTYDGPTASTNLEVAAQRFANWFIAALRAVGKIGGKIKKHVYQGHDLDEQTVKVVKANLATVVEAVYTMAGCHGLTLFEVCDANIKKLRQRYPGGKFSKEASVNRTV